MRGICRLGNCGAEGALRSPLPFTGEGPGERVLFVFGIALRRLMFLAP